MRTVLVLVFILSITAYATLSNDVTTISLDSTAGASTIHDSSQTIDGISSSTIPTSLEIDALGGASSYNDDDDDDWWEHLFDDDHDDDEDHEWEDDD